jgi:hypothetical protein
MRQEGQALIITLLVAFFCVFATDVAAAEKKMPDTMALKIEGAKLGPVPFSHITHTEKAKIDCTTCHHKDKNSKEPDKCETCHMLKEVKEKAVPAKDAFHKKCQTCHKENVAKGGGAPVKCNDCHKK